MQDRRADFALPGAQSALLFETPAEIYARVFRALRPRTSLPEFRVEFCRFANADSFIRLEDGRVHVRITDLLEGAPAPVQEALAYILIGKLFRRPIPRLYTHRYRLYLNRRDMRRQMHLVRQMRGRKFVSGPVGKHRNLEEVFEQLNARHFHGLLGRPRLGWSRRPSRSMLGHFDPSHNAIIISSIFDDPNVPLLTLEYVLFHEMLHLRFPVDHSGARRRVHTREFRAAEREFPYLKEAKEMLKKL
ncbi:MAG TPA: SprT-like domain-containing protein [Bryobacteraceae bacterium]|nr:SprT-like domain-containing protein [Bryobacteraceae bacterium]